MKKQQNEKPFSCLAIDMGAGSIRIVRGIFSDKLEMEEVWRFDNVIEFDNGHERWNLTYIKEQLRKGIQKAITESPVKISSIGVDSWGVDFVLLDHNGEPLENPVAYRDARTKGMRGEWGKTMGDYETFCRTGINYNIFNSLYQFLSLKGSELLKRTGNILFMADYINYFLSGTIANELTLAGTTQMLNVETKNWDKEIVEHLGIGNKLSKTITMPGTVLGQLKGFGKHSPDIIAVAGHDTASAVAAIPFSGSASVFISTGTWCIVGILSNKPLLSREAYEMGITNEIAANGQFRPLKNLMGLWIVQQLRAAFGNVHTYPEIDRMVEKIEVGNMLIDTNDERFYNPENMKQAIDAYLEEHNLPLPASEAHYYRCVYESLSHSLARTIGDLERLSNKTFSEIHITGGGSKSELLCNTTANLTGKKILCGPVEGAAMGNLLIQAKAKGFYQ